jgi:hypothetical protein
MYCQIGDDGEWWCGECVEDIIVAFSKTSEANEEERMHN